MLRYILRKLLLAIPLVVGVVTLIFLLVELSPGTVADKYFDANASPEVQQMIEAKFGLNQPVGVRYLKTLRNLLTLDFGVSMDGEEPVFDLIWQKLPNTLLLSFITLLVMYPFGIALGVFQAMRQGKASDTAVSVSSLFFYSMPSFWLAIMLQLAFTYYLPLLPASGMRDALAGLVEFTPWEQFVDVATHLVLPGLAMGLAHSAGVARYMRSSMLDVIRQDYIRTARAKGLSEWTVVTRHAVRNALLPIITLMGLSLPMLFSGAVLVESIFGWPGMGLLIVEAIKAQDTPVIIACFFVFTLVVVAGNLLADLLYAVVDPRIEYE